MSTLSLRLPNSLHDRIRKLAEAEGVSINQFIATAVAEKTAALLTDEYLSQRADRASRTKFRNALKRIPERPADKGDEQ
ncbi:MAG: toxin-antitoxin system HicB family antitoxin [Rhodothermales bacterium]|nr:toxin-antitoxin system HicB family antitoxin [Rhodothermales bacterium]